MLPAEKNISEQLSKHKISLKSKKEKRYELHLKDENGEYFIDEVTDFNKITSAFLSQVLRELSNHGVKELKILGAYVTGPLTLKNVHIDYDINFGVCNFSEGFICEDTELQKVDFIICTVRQIYLRSCVINGSFLMSGTPDHFVVCNGGMFFADTEFKGRVSVLCAKMSTQWKEDEYTKPLDTDAVISFVRCSILGWCDLMNVFCFGRVDYKLTNISGVLNIQNSLIGNFLRTASLNCVSSNVGQGVQFKESFFWGRLVFDHGKIGGVSTFTDIELAPSVVNQVSSFQMDYPSDYPEEHCACSAENSEFYDLTIVNSRVAGYLSFTRTVFHCDLRIQDTTITEDFGSVLLLGVDKKKDFFGIDIDQPSEFNKQNGPSEASKIQCGISLRFAKVHGVFRTRNLNKSERFFLDLENANCVTLEDTIKDWPKKGNLFISGLDYEVFLSDASREERINWLRLQDQQRYNPQPYNRLKQYYMQLGLRESAIKTAMLSARHKSNQGNLPLLNKMLYYISLATIGNGYKPNRSLIWILGVIIISSVVFSNAQIITISEVRVRGNFNAIMYSIDSFLPIIDFNHAKHFWFEENTTIKWWRIYYWFHVAAGWILTSIAVVGFTGMIRKAND